MKKIIIFIMIILLSGCKKTTLNIKTEIIDKENCLISINYPITKENKLNKEIITKVKKIKKDFLKTKCNLETNTKHELNIDFEYKDINNKYISILIKTYNNELETYFYDKKEKNILNIIDIMTSNDLNTLNNTIKNNTNLEDLNFTIDNEYIYVYKDNYIKKIELDKFDLKIKINKENIIKEKNTYKKVDKIIDYDKKVIALTFDDGPSKYTKKIVDLLNEYDANATFFILGNKVEIYNETLTYLLESGNEIGNHSYNHKWLKNVAKEELLEQITKTQDIIEKNLNYTPTLFRPTYGSVNNLMKENVKLDIVLWNLDTLDWKYKNSKKISENLLKKVKDKDIILMHDTYEYTYNALKIIIPALKEEGYQFITVSELKKLNEIQNKQK